MERLAGYISGWTVDLARVSDKQGVPRLLRHQRFQSQEFSNFYPILELYLRKSRIKFDVACIGVAGPVISNKVITTTRKWHFDGPSIESQFSIKKVKLINSVVAAAHSIPLLGDDKFYVINEGRKGKNGNLGIVAAGSGLGEAIIYSDGKKLHPYASEGGHADFAPGNQLESELWEYLYPELGTVETEDVVSWSGLERIYSFLVDTHGGHRSSWFTKAKDRPSAIIEKALAGKDKTATEALDIFIDCFASEASNLALNGMTIGGVHLSGVIAPRIITAIDRRRFMERFVKKGKMEELLSRIPVGVINEEAAPLLGAASVVLSM